MGAYAPVSIADTALVDRIVAEIFNPTMGALRERGRAFTGLLYAGLMITDEGPKVVEFNCRFGDPETQALLPLLKSSLLEPVAAIARGDRLTPGDQLHWRSGASVTTVVAAAGYPDAPRKGDAIEIAELPEDALLFHAGTSRAPSGQLATAGGRVARCHGLRRQLRRGLPPQRGGRGVCSFRRSPLPN